MLANVATSAASQRLSAPDDAQAARGTSRTPRRAAQVGHQPSVGCCAAAVPHQQLVPPPRRPAAPRWLRERATSGVDWGWGGGGILASCPRWPPHRDGRAVERRAALPSSGFQGQKKASPAPSLSEIAISLNCGLNSARKFQTGVSNSGPQIPKHARQNSEVPEITNFS